MTANVTRNGKSETVQLFTTSGEYYLIEMTISETDIIQVSISDDDISSFFLKSKKLKIM